MRFDFHATLVKFVITEY